MYGVKNKSVLTSFCSAPALNEDKPINITRIAIVGKKIIFKFFIMLYIFEAESYVIINKY
jgi:hypothetical protein